MKTYKCTKCKAVFFSRDDLRQHQFEHLYPNASFAENISRLSQITEKEQMELSSTEEIIEDDEIASFDEAGASDEVTGPKAPETERWFIAKQLVKHKCVVVSTLQLDPNNMPDGWGKTGSSHDTQAGARAEFRKLCGNNNNC
jgi:hypothetical protein